MIGFDSSDCDAGELREALRSAEDLHLTDAELDDLFDDLGVKDSGGLHAVLSYEVLHDVLTSGRYRKTDDGRYFVLLSLAEAETIRMVMHLRQGSQVVEGKEVALALRCLPAHDAVFDLTDNFPPPPRYQASAAYNCSP